MIVLCNPLTNRCKTVAGAARRFVVWPSQRQLEHQPPIAPLTAVELAEQAPHEPREHHRRAVVAGMSLGAALDVFERPHAVADDAQVVLPRDLALGLADAE
jgi:hypothetical protein